VAFTINSFAFAVGRYIVQFTVGGIYLRLCHGWDKEFQCPTLEYGQICAKGYRMYMEAVETLLVISAYTHMLEFSEFEDQRISFNAQIAFRNV